MGAECSVQQINISLITVLMNNITRRLGCLGNSSDIYSTQNTLLITVTMGDRWGQKPRPPDLNKPAHYVGSHLSSTLCCRSEITRARVKQISGQQHACPCCRCLSWDIAKTTHSFLPKRSTFASAVVVQGEVWHSDLHDQIYVIILINYN
jgi:hypothetical protein